MSPDHDTAPHDPCSDSDFGKALIQAMDDFAHSTTAPAFDSERIVRRTRRRRGMLALTTCAAVVAAGMALTVTLDSSPKPATTAAAAPSRQVPAAPVGTPGSPTWLGPASCANLWPSPSDAAQETVTVPDLTGMDQSHATAALAADGLHSSPGKMNERTAKRVLSPAHSTLIGPDGTIPAGTVVCTSPMAGTRVAPGEFVALFIVQA